MNANRQYPAAHAPVKARPLGARLPQVLRKREEYSLDMLFFKIQATL